MGLVGEAVISAFEVRGGCRVPIVLMLCLGSMAIGFLLSPRRVLRAWMRARGVRALYGTPVPYDDLLAMEVVALRQDQGIPPDGFVRSSWHLPAPSPEG